MSRKKIVLTPESICRVFFLDVLRMPFALFDCKFVKLFDFSDETRYVIRMVRKHKGAWGAWRVGMGIRFVELYDSGVVESGSYVTGWEPYKLFTFEYETVPEEVNDFPKWGGEKW